MKQKKNIKLWSLGCLLGVLALVGIVVQVLRPDLATRYLTSTLPFIEYTETFEQDEEVYLVYFWQETCIFCTEFEPYIMDAVNNYNVPIFVVDLAEDVNNNAWYDWEMHHEIHSRVIGYVNDDGSQLYPGEDMEFYSPAEGWEIVVDNDGAIHARLNRAFNNQNPLDYSQIEISGTPTLLLIRNGIVERYASGIPDGQELLNYFKEME